MKKIVVTTTSFGEYDELPIRICKGEGYDIVTNPYKRKIKSDELVDFAKDAVGIIAGTESITGDVLGRLTCLKVISRCGAGLENVDMAAAKKAGVQVFNTPDAPTLAVAELTVGLMLNLLRKTVRMDTEIRAGRWNKLMGNLLSGKKVGIVGFGRIGKKVFELLKAFDCEMSYFDPFIKGSAPDARCFPKEELLRWADIITIHAASKERIIGEKELRSMKDGAWLINVSRGEAVDENALYGELKNGRLSGAALDVFREEPYGGPLKDLSNVILTPHIGSYAKESRVMMEREAVENLLKGLRKENE